MHPDIPDILSIDVPRTVPALVQRGGGDAYFGHGITLRVTEKMAQLIVEDPDEATEKLVVDSGRSFLFVR